MSLLVDVRCDGCGATIQTAFSAYVKLPSPWVKIVYHYPRLANVPAGVYHACGAACILPTFSKFLVSGVRGIDVHCGINPEE